MFNQTEGFTKIFKGVSERTGMVFDEKAFTVNGKVNGYNVSVIRHLGNYVAVQYSVRKDGQLPTADVIRKVGSVTKGVVKSQLEGNKVVILLMGGTDKCCTERTVSALERISMYFHENGYVDVCENCGKVVDSVSFYGQGGDRSHFCSNCIENAEQIMASRRLAESDIPENVALGFLGAIIGSLLGVVAIILLGWAGFVASIGGLLMAVGVLYGYKTLGGKLSVKGIVISVAVMIVMTYVSERAVWSMVICDALSENYNNVSMLAVFLNFNGIIAEAEMAGAFIKDLLLVYGFTALGAFPTIKKNYIEKRGTSNNLVGRKAA